jgi:hypothetical protein
MQLAEAAAVWVEPARQADADADQEDGEESYRPASSIPSETGMEQRRCNRDFCRWEQLAQRPYEHLRQTEIAQSLVPPFAVSQLGDTGKQKYGRQEKPGHQQSA